MLLWFISSSNFSLEIAYPYAVSAIKKVFHSPLSIPSLVEKCVLGLQKISNYCASAVATKQTRKTRNVSRRFRSKRLTKKKKEKHEELLLFTSIAGFRGKYSCSAYFDASFTVSVGVYYSDGFFSTDLC